MEMTYKNLKTRDRFFNRALRGNLQKLSFIFPEYVSKDNLMKPFDCGYSAAGYGELMCEYGR